MSCNPNSYALPSTSKGYCAIPAINQNATQVMQQCCGNNVQVQQIQPCTLYCLLTGPIAGPSTDPNLSSTPGCLLNGGVNFSTCMDNTRSVVVTNGEVNLDAGTSDPISTTSGASTTTSTSSSSSTSSQSTSSSATTSTTSVPTQSVPTTSTAPAPTHTNAAMSIPVHRPLSIFLAALLVTSLLL